MTPPNDDSAVFDADSVTNENDSESTDSNVDLFKMILVVNQTREKPI